MDVTSLAALLLVALLVLIFAGMPIAFALGLSSAVVLALWKGPAALGQLANTSYFMASSFLLVSVPLFIFMSEILLATKISEELYDSASKWFGRVPGGLAMASVAACAGFSGICGSSAATAGAIGVIAIPEMEKHGYDKKLAMGAVAAGGTLGPLIPPSVQMILYGAITGTSVGKLFLAGVLPGIVITVLLMGWIWFVCARNPLLAPLSPQSSWKERFVALRRLWIVVVLMFIVLGGIYAGVMTPTESAAVGALGSILIAALVYRRVNAHTLLAAAQRAAQFTSVIMLIVICALFFGYTLTFLRVPQEVAAFVTSLPVSRWVILALISLLLIALGCILDPASILLITVPILFPAVTALGFDPIWFGIVFVVNMEIGNITPPVGMNLFVVRSISKASMGEVIAGATPFLVPLTIGLVIVIAFPALSLWLPSMMK